MTGHNGAKAGRAARVWGCLLVASFGLLAVGAVRAEIPFQLGSALEDRVQDVAVDPEGALIVAGTFQGAMTLGSAPGVQVTLRAEGGKDLFVARFGPSGSLDWAARGGGVGDEEALAVAVSESGSLYVTGTFVGTATFGSQRLTGDPYARGMIAKLDRFGNWVWARQTNQRTTRATGLAVAPAPLDAVYYAGFWGSVPGVFFSAKSELVRLDSQGNQVWALPLDQFYVDGVAAGRDGRVYLSGVAKGNALGSAFCGGENGGNFANDVELAVRVQDHEPTEEGDPAAYGECQRATNLGTTFGVGGTAITFDGTNVYYANSDDNRFRVAQLSETGDVVWNVNSQSVDTQVWSNEIGNLLRDKFERGAAVEGDGRGNVYVSGHYRGTVSLPSVSVAPFPLPDLAGNRNVFVAKYGPTGNLAWARTPDRGRHAMPDDPRPSYASSYARLFGLTEASLSGSIALFGTSQLYVAGALQGVATLQTDATTEELLSSDYPAANLELRNALAFNEPGDPDGETPSLGDALSPPGGALNGLGDMTLEFRFKGTAPFPQSGSTILSAAGSGSTNELYVILHSAGDKVDVGLKSYGMTFNLPSNAGDGKWHHFALLRTAGGGSVCSGNSCVSIVGSVALYMDGVRAGVFPFTPSGPLNVDAGGLILGQEQDAIGGAFDSRQALVGELDEVRVWERRLEESEIEARRSVALAGDETGLRAYWRMDRMKWRADQFCPGIGPGGGSPCVVVEDASGHGWDAIQGVADYSVSPSVFRDTQLRGPHVVALEGGTSDGYVALLGTSDGKWLLPQTWALGAAIAPPGGVKPNVPPVIKIDGLSDAEAKTYFYWNSYERKLYARGVAPGPVTIEWSPLDTSLDPIRTSGVSVLPPLELIQYHVAGTTVELEPAHAPGDPGTHLRLYAAESYPQQDVLAAVNGTTFARAAPVGTQPTYLVLHYTRTNTADEDPNPNAQESVFQVVYTKRWDELKEENTEDCVIGQPLTDARHDDPSGRNGYVLFEKARFDGSGGDRAHDRATRRGPIFPVNTDTDAADDDMAVVWFRTNALGQTWGEKPVRYKCKWPTDPPEIVIADQRGSGPLPGNFVNRRVYNQPDATKPGYNPNEEHALLTAGESGLDLFALRNDLNALSAASEPYALLKYQDASNGNAWGFRVYKVVATTATDKFAPTAGGDLYRTEAGQLLQRPKPLANLPACPETPERKVIVSDPDGVAWRDVNGDVWARAESASNITLHLWYPLQEGFWYDLDRDGSQDEGVNTCVPWLDRLPSGQPGVPVDVEYAFKWPASVPVLSAGATLFSAKAAVCSTEPSPEPCYLPDINGQAAAQIIYDQARSDTDPASALVKLIDPLSPRGVTLAALPGSLATAFQGGKRVFVDLPFHLRTRLSYDEQTRELSFKGYPDKDALGTAALGDPHLLPNIMTLRERNLIRDLPGADQAFKEAVDALYHKSRNPSGLSLDLDLAPDQGYYVGLQPQDADGDGKPDPLLGDDGGIDQQMIAEPQSLVGVPMALTAGRAAGTGYVTLAFNNHPSVSGNGVSLQVLKVGCPVYQGNIWVVPSDNVFEEALTLRHTGDFAGDPDAIDFQWYYQPDTGDQPAVPDADPPVSPWVLHPESGPGALDVTIAGPGLLTLSDNWFVVRYGGKGPGTGLGVCGNELSPSPWAGDPATANPVRAKLATGWIKRVVDGLNPFDQRVRDFRDSEVNTIASMIAQAGEPYAGPIPFNPDADVINAVGLIEAYQTVLERGKDLSVDAGFNDVAANTQLLNVATRVADLYTLLGNEAFADAADPTVGFDTGSEYGSLASSMFAFQNQLESPLEEELVLLRGRDDSHAGVAGYPVFNRLLWNCTQGLGEVAYVQTYNIGDPAAGGFDCEANSRNLYPQGHGDAWGHYLTSAKARYTLLREPNFTWVPRAESVAVAGAAVKVDYLDERKFALTAAAKARAGAEIVNLTYRREYVEDPLGQWQGYKDTDTDRAWGLDGWGRRAGQGAYFDWLTANAILPAVDPNPNHTGIARVDRTTVPELAQLAAEFIAIQSQVDRADGGLNPVGLAKGAVPFDIDPNFLQVGSTVQGKTHFDQVAERAQSALKNAVRVFDHASQQSQRLRAVQDDAEALTRTVAEQERDYKNRLIEIFGLPFAGAKGAGKTYPADYDGPDLLYFNYVSTGLVPADAVSGLERPEPDGPFKVTAYLAPFSFDDNTCAYFFPDDLKNLDGSLASPEVCEDIENNRKAVDFPLVPGADWSFVAPAAWGERAATGEIQVAISELLQATARLQQAKWAHASLVEDIKLAEQLVKMQAANYDIERTIQVAHKNRVTALNNEILGYEIGETVANRLGGIARDVAEVLEEANDGDLPSKAISAGSIPMIAVTLAAANVAEIVGDALGLKAGDLERDKDEAGLQAELDVFTKTNDTALGDRARELQQLVRQEAVLRLELYTQAEQVQQALGQYRDISARGQRLVQERLQFRKYAAADTQEHRYRDMTFRVFRNDALQKFRAQFDLAARYVYLAATAYDYETNLLGGENGSGRKFLADVVRQRSVGQVLNGTPVAGTPGLADILARLTQNFDVYRGQLGFNNPQVETNRFSLRRELFRIRDESDEAWRQTLERAYVPDLWDIPEFRRYARPFAPESLGPQPGLVLRFPTTVTFGLNFFGHALGGGDSAYDPSNFATKVRSVGTWFTNYDGTALSNTPRIYLIPTGMDVLRSPADDTLATREWRVIDQKVPVPFPVGASDLTNPAWIPVNDSLSDTYGGIRRFSSFRAYHDSGAFDASQTTSDSRLVGRSVWNTEWLLIIPGGTLLYDSEEGLDQFVHGRLVPGNPSLRDGNGISDIKLFFQTYGYSGN